MKADSEPRRNGGMEAEAQHFDLALKPSAFFGEDLPVGCSHAVPGTYADLVGGGILVS